MRGNLASGLFLGAFAACLAGQGVHAKSDDEVVLAVTSKEGNASSPLLFGTMFEEMDHSGDGGIHGQLLQNNGFQGSSPNLSAYKAVGDVDIALDAENPVSHAINASLQVSVPSDTTGWVGFANTGYAGVPVVEAIYSTSFWIQGDYDGTVTVQLVGVENGRVYGSKNFTVHSEPGKFKQFNTTFQSVASPDGDNDWRVLFDAQKVQGSSLNFGLVELFPPTYHGRANGLRDDAATFLADTRPAFLRFPGGNNLEGLEVGKRWMWNQTIGRPVDRPGRDSDWFYPNTDALGLDEYMWWCEDMNMEPLLAVWAGKSYGDILSGPELVPYVEDIMNELEYLLGPVESKWGRVRAKNGRVEPWKIKYVEIGNEDDLTHGCATYPERFTQIYNAIHLVYPDITLIASNGNETCLPSPLPPNVFIDLHYYRKPDKLVELFDQFDNFPRDRGVIVGEWGCRNSTAERGQFWGYVQGSCSEAVNMISFERNSDIVKMTSYSPMIQNFAFTQWSPTLYGLDSTPDSLTPSTSYYIQKMFAENKGTTILPVSSSTGFGPLYWVASKNDTSTHVKLANYGADPQTVKVSIPDTSSGVLETLSGPQFEGNRPHDVRVVPQRHGVRGPAGNYTVVMPPWGVAILAVA